MIRLTSIVGEPFLLNAELIRTVEQRPDTYISLTTGERLIVAEPMEEVLRLVIEYQRSKHLFPPQATRDRPWQTAPFSSALQSRQKAQ